MLFLYITVESLCYTIPGQFCTKRSLGATLKQTKPKSESFRPKTSTPGLEQPAGDADCIFPTGFRLTQAGPGRAQKQRTHGSSEWSYGYSAY